MFAKVCILATAIVFAAGIGLASTIIVDGVNDFPSEALIDADGGDTEFVPIDMGNVYVTYDATSLYIGYEHDQDGWTGVQVGIAIMFPELPGGATDPWAHQIDFQGTCLPHFIAYINIDSEWNEWCVWNGSDWDRTPNILNWVVNTGFDEIELPYDLMGIDCTIYSQVFLELWVTQEGTTKGPLDLSYNDDLQLSTPGGTIWDIDEPVMIGCYHCIELFGPSAAEMTTWGKIKQLYR